jgi:hypothetical protein
MRVSLSAFETNQKALHGSERLSAPFVNLFNHPRFCFENIFMNAEMNS